MFSKQRDHRWSCLWLSAVAMALAAPGGLTPAVVHAGKIQLKNGTVLEGELVPIKGLTPSLMRRTSGPPETFPIIMVHTGFKRYFVSRRQVDQQNSDWSPELSPGEVFELQQPKRGRRPGPRKLGSVRILKPWSAYGRRTVEVVTSRGKQPIVQGVTKITPKYLEVEGLTHTWKHGVAVTSVPPKALHAMLIKATDRSKPADRMAVVRYYIQAGMYDAASRELEQLQRDFPDYKQRAKETQFELRTLTAKKIIAELRRRQKAGQHRLVYQSFQQFPKENVTAAALREISLIEKDYDDARSRAERALMLLVDLESQLQDDKTLRAVKPMRSEVGKQLNYESLPRLDAFLKLSADTTLSTQEKLALAYSGWILGSGNATTNLDVTIRLWEARFYVMEYLRTVNSLQRKRLLERIDKLEGVNPEHIGQMVPYLPPLIETPEVKPGKTHILEVAGRDGQPPLKYAVLLPPEYNRHHRYPLIVSLRPRERTIEQAVQWWGGTAKKPGQAQRHGYIVIAPQYAGGKQAPYDYSSQAHARVIECLRDVRKRFSIDSDRVFLSGHGSGGDAAFDIGMSHPDLFAGVIPIVGISDKYSMWYYLNAKHLPWYIVSGELARNSLERNARELTRMMTKPPFFDVIYAEYIGRGYESYYEEIHQLFDWMALHRRRKHPKKVEVRTLRPSDNRFWWVRASGFPRNVTQSTVLVDKAPKTRPMKLTAWVNPSNDVILRSGADEHTLWLSPDFIDYSERVNVRLVGLGRKVYSGFLTRELDTLLEDLRIRGDRQKLYWTRLDVSRRFRSQ